MTQPRLIKAYLSEIAHGALGRGMCRLLSCTPRRLWHSSAAMDQLLRILALFFCLLTVSSLGALTDTFSPFDTLIPTRRGGAESSAACISQALQQVIPRCVEREAEAVEHVDSGVRGSCFDALNVAAVDLCTFCQVILSQSALHSQAVDVFPEYGTRRQTHSPNVCHSAETVSGLIVAFSGLRWCWISVLLPSLGCK